MVAMFLEVTFAFASTEEADAALPALM
jgi:hypothetical protein